MRSAIRFLAWMTVVMVIGVQVTGLGTLGFTICVERFGGLCALEAVSHPCCAQTTCETFVDDHQPAVACDYCIDLSLALPTAAVVTPILRLDSHLADTMSPIQAAIQFAPSWISVTAPERSYRNRSPPLPDSVLISQTHVLRI